MKINSSKKSRNRQTFTDFTRLKPLNDIQDLYLSSIMSNSVIFGIGSAGTGKTYIPVGFAAEQLYYKNIDKIILTRPNVETGRSLGALPGELEEKYAPYIEPFDSMFKEFLGKGFYEYCIKNKNIEPKPLNYQRGATFDNCIVLADEMQNATKSEIKMLLTRIGYNCKIVMTGDPDQSDIPNSGLMDAVERLSEVDKIDIMHFYPSDIVRSKICKDIILAYNK